MPDSLKSISWEMRRLVLLGSSKCVATLVEIPCEEIWQLRITHPSLLVSKLRKMQDIVLLTKEIKAEMSVWEGSVKYCLFTLLV